MLPYGRPPRKADGRAVVDALFPESREKKRIEVANRAKYQQ